MTAWIRKRTTGSGDRWDVLYRAGGTQSHRAGCFTVKRDAEVRLSVVRGWLAQGKDPKRELSLLFTSTVRERSCDELWPEWVAGLRDVGVERKRVISYANKHISPVIGTIAPSRVTESDGLRLLNRMTDLSASTQHQYFSVAVQFLKSLDVDPWAKVRLPKVQRDDVQAMPYQHWLLIRDHVRQTPEGEGMLLALDVIEACGLRVGDAEQLLIGDIDFYEGKIRVSKARGKSAKSRWVPCPAPLLDQLAGHPVGERAFPSLTSAGARYQLKRACEKAGLPHYHPHDLRHRRASVWIAQGVPITDVSYRLGHSSTQMTLDVYAHVVSSAEDVWTKADYVEVGK